MTRAAQAVLSAAPLLLAGCSGPQSALETHGPDAGRIAEIGWVLFAGAALIFLVVMALAAHAALGGRRRPGWLAGRGLVIGGGLVFPIVTLSALLIYTFGVAGTLTAPPQEPPLRIAVTGRMWWWDVRYPDGPGGAAVRTANEIRVPVGRPVEVIVTTADVIHSFWVPSLAGKIDMIPNRVNRLRLQADRPGVFRGQCAEYCGAQHAAMAFHVVAEPPEAFAAWLRGQAAPAREPDRAELVHGRRLFLDSGCGACHAVRGTPADGQFGPDLTHVGGRLTIAAGILPNNAGTLAGWIADSQHLKPSNRMPSFNSFAGEELRAIAAYLASLR